MDFSRVTSWFHHSDGSNRHIGRKIALIVLVLAFIGGGILFWKADAVLQKISSGNGGIFENLMKTLPGVENKLAGEEEGRINVALLAMRGKDVPGGGLLADTIMVLSIHPSSGEGDVSKASLVSIPRDLYVTVPSTSDQQKINAVHFYGEEKGEGQGMEYMKQVLADVTGVPIHYAVTINFKGFTDLVDALGGIDVTLEKPFREGLQFHEPHVCDEVVFTKPALNDKGQQLYECKYSKKPRSSLAYVKPTWDPYPLCVNKPEAELGVYKVMAQYPLCYNESEECNGIFQLPAGENHLDGANALCFARARYGSNDFERARRQQEVIKEIREKALSIGTLADFGKITALFDSLGNNVRTDMAGWELKRLFDLYQSIGDAKLTQKVLENTEEGLLYHPENSDPAAGYILLPIGDNYDRIHALFQSLP